MWFWFFGNGNNNYTYAKFILPCYLNYCFPFFLLNNFYSLLCIILGVLSLRPCLHGVGDPGLVG